MKMRKFHLLKFTLVIVVLILLPLTTVGGQSSSFATYYVDGSFGSDSNSGSNSAPWRSVQHAIDTINSGDTVIVRGGYLPGRAASLWPSRAGFSASYCLQGGSW